MADSITADLKREASRTTDLESRPSLQPTAPCSPANKQVTVPGDQKFVVYKYRWVVLISYCLIKCCSCATYGLFVPFSTLMSKIYGIQHVFIVLTSYTFNGLYPFASFLIADPIISSKGIGFSVRSPDTPFPVAVHRGRRHARLHLVAHPPQRMDLLH